jgi:hypothetical protein
LLKEDNNDNENATTSTAAGIVAGKAAEEVALARDIG